MAVFASGSGSNYEAIAKACSEGVIDAEVVLLVCDKPGAYVLERAKRYGTECFAFNPKEYGSREAYETVLATMLDEREVDFVCLAGYMRIVGKVLRKHPPLVVALVQGCTRHSGCGGLRREALWRYHTLC